MRVCLGGTFDPFHAGHERLLGKALALAGPEGHVFVGLVSDAFTRSKRKRAVRPLAERRMTLDMWLAGQGATDRVQVRELTEPHGPSATGDYDAIVVSPDTQATARDINETRKRNGLRPLAIHVLPFVLGDDLLPISGTRIAAGLVDRDGRRVEPLLISVGSTNPAKLDATRRAFLRFAPQARPAVIGYSVTTGVPAQPKGADDTARGAIHRAEAALAAGRVHGAEYGVGIEAGLVADAATGAWLDVQYAAIVDASGRRTLGHGPGFAHPPTVLERVGRGDTVGDAMVALSGDVDIGKKEGAVGWLTTGILDRTRLSESAVEAALVPRVRRELYDGAALPWRPSAAQHPPAPGMPPGEMHPPGKRPAPGAATTLFKKPL